MTDNRETIEMLKMLKEQALKSHNDTAVLEVKIDSLNFVLDEAIKALKQEPCEDWYDVPSDEMTLEQAKQAVKDLRKKLAEYLEQKPCEDCISRQAVLDINEHHHGQMPNHVNHEIWKEIKALPSVTPKEKTGKWEYVQYDGNPNIGNWYCSGGADMKDLTHKMAEFFRGEDFYTKGEDARLELTPEELRLISAWLSENARLISKNKLLKEAIGKIKSELKNSYIGECLYDGGIERGINLIDKHTEGLI